MHIQIGRDRRLDLIQNGPELLAAVPSLVGANHVTHRDVERGKQICGAGNPGCGARAVRGTWAAWGSYLQPLESVAFHPHTAPEPDPEDGGKVNRSGISGGSNS
jgi:hypothetical protein